MNRYLTLIFFVFLIFCGTTKFSYSQNNKLTALDTIEAKMEVMQEERNWSRMITLGESSLKKGFDSFFIRARLGIAYYETQNYLKAIPQLEEALKTGIDNPTILNNLYYCYSYTGREADKNYVFSNLSPKAKTRIKPLENKVVNDLLVDFGFAISDDKNETPGAVNPENGDLYNEQTLTQNAFTVGVGINQLLFQSLSIDFYYAYLSLDKKKIISYGTDQTSNSYTEKQNRFYNRFNIRLTEGLVFSPAGHFIGTDYSTIYGNVDNTNKTDNSGTQTFSITEQGNIYDGFVLSADITKYLTKMSFGINGSFSYLNNIHQSQLGGSFKIFPFGKATLYSKSDITLQEQSDVTNIVFNQSFGGFYNRIFFYEMFFTLGKINNFNERNGSLVYNNPDLITFKAGFDLKYYINPRFNVELGYSFQSRERNTITYLNTSTNDQPVSQKASLVTYSVNNIFGGLKYSF